MFWGCMTASGTGDLHKVEERMNAAQYRKILKESLQTQVKKPKMKRQYILQDTKSKISSGMV